MLVKHNTMVQRCSQRTHVLGGGLGCLFPRFGSFPLISTPRPPPTGEVLTPTIFPPLGKHLCRQRHNPRKVFSVLDPTCCLGTYFVSPPEEFFSGLPPPYLPPNLNLCPPHTAFGVVPKLRTFPQNPPYCSEKQNSFFGSSFSAPPPWNLRYKSCCCLRCFFFFPPP